MEILHPNVRIVWGARSLVPIVLIGVIDRFVFHVGVWLGLVVDLVGIVVVVPFVRAQHVDTQRGLIERLVGLASVVIYTTGSRGAEMTIIFQEIRAQPRDGGAV